MDSSYDLFDSDDLRQAVDAHCTSEGDDGGPSKCCLACDVGLALQARALPGRSSRAYSAGFRIGKEQGRDVECDMAVAWLREQHAKVIDARRCGGYVPESFARAAEGIEEGAHWQKEEGIS